jgi:hypothetical protein
MPHLRMKLVQAVDPHHARLELMHCLDRPVEVRAEHGSGKTVHRAVSLDNDVYMKDECELRGKQR